MFRVETVKTLGPNRRLHNFPLEEKVTREARTFPCPNPSHLLGVGKRGCRNLQDRYFLCEFGKVPTQMAVVFSPLTGGGLKEPQGLGEVFAICSVPCAFHLVSDLVDAQEILTE